LLVEDLRDVVADVAEPLDGDSLPVERSREAGLLERRGIAERLTQSEDHAAARRLAAAAHAPLRQGLAGDARPVVDATRVEGVVRVGDPRHLALAGAVIGGGDVDAGTDEVLRNQLGGVAAGDLLELLGSVVARAELDAAFRAAEGDVADRALVGHES